MASATKLHAQRRVLPVRQVQEEVELEDIFKTFIRSKTGLIGLQLAPTKDSIVRSSSQAAFPPACSPLPIFVTAILQNLVLELGTVVYTVQLRLLTFAAVHLIIICTSADTCTCSNRLTFLSTHAEIPELDGYDC